MTRGWADGIIYTAVEIDLLQSRFAALSHVAATGGLWFNFSYGLSDSFAATYFLSTL